MMEAWLSSSETMKSSLPRMAETVPGVGGESTLEDNAGFNILEAGDFFFQFHVDFHSAGDGADGAGADAVVADGLNGGLAQLWVIAQAR